MSKSVHLISELGYFQFNKVCIKQWLMVCISKRDAKRSSQGSNKDRILQTDHYIGLWLGLCKLVNDILKKAKNAEKSHF